jgi:hypothetical protein
VSRYPDDRRTLKFQMMMSPSEAKTLDDWMFANRVRSRAKAIRMLIADGLRANGIAPTTSNESERVNP